MDIDVVDVVDLPVTGIRTLEKITVAGLQCNRAAGDDEGRKVMNEGEEEEEEEKKVTVNVALYNKEYYCLDDPMILHGRERVRVRVIAEVNSEQELYEEYVRNNVRNMLNPYRLLLLYKEQKIKDVPEEVKEILTRNLPLDDGFLRMLDEHLLKLEERNRGKPIFISLDVLDAISIIEHYIEKGLAREEVLRLIDEYIDEQHMIIHYPSPDQIVVYVEALYAEEEEERKREEERRRIDSLKKERNKDVKTKIYDLIVVPSTTTAAATADTAMTDTATVITAAVGRGGTAVEDDQKGREDDEDERKEVKEKDEERGEAAKVVVTYEGLRDSLNRIADSILSKDLITTSNVAYADANSTAAATTAAATTTADTAASDADSTASVIRVITVGLRYPAYPVEKREKIEQIIDRSMKRFIAQLESHGITVTL